MSAEYDLMEDGTVRPAPVKFKDPRGRPKGYSPKKAAKLAADSDGVDGEDDSNDQNALTVRKARAAASKMEADAANAWLKHKIDSGEYLSRTAFKEAMATVLSEIAQALRSLPDALERRHGLAPEIVQAVEATVDETLADAASTMEMFVQRPVEKVES